MTWSTNYNGQKLDMALERLEVISSDRFEQLIGLFRETSSATAAELAFNLRASVGEVEDDLRQLTAMGLACPSAREAGVYQFNHYNYLRLMLLATQVAGATTYVAETE